MELTQRPTSGSEPLTTERIVEVALELVAEVGVDDLSMRELARRLGSAPMSLYRHVADRDMLIVLCIEELARHVRDRTPAQGPWRTVVIVCLTAVRDVLSRHPGLARHVMARPEVSPTVLEIMDRVAAALMAAGLSPAAAAQTHAALWALTLGDALVELAVADARAAGHGESTGDPTGEPTGKPTAAPPMAAAFAGGGAAAYPALSAIGTDWLDLDRRAAFTVTVGQLLDGVVGARRSGRGVGGVVDGR